jgi:hypothetical protein
MANVNVSVMADRTQITVAIVRLRTTEPFEGSDIFFKLMAAFMTFTNTLLELSKSSVTIMTNHHKNCVLPFDAFTRLLIVLSIG